MVSQHQHLREHDNFEPEEAILLSRKMTEMNEEVYHVVHGGHGAHENHEGSRQFHAKSEGLMAKNCLIEHIADQMYQQVQKVQFGLYPREGEREGGRAEQLEDQRAIMGYNFQISHGRSMNDEIAAVRLMLLPSLPWHRCPRG